LKNRKAVGLDNLNAELIKNGPPELANIIADIFNKSISQGEDLELGLAKVITLQKPEKQVGPVKNIRPIALLPLLRKILSTVTLMRIRGSAEQYLSPAQAAFRKNRCTSDIVWAHRWLIAKTLRYKTTVHILGLDMSRAFDTINREKLMDILETIPGMTNDDRQLIRILLSNTSLQVSFNGLLTKPFQSTIGSPQGDGLSPLLFAIYLEAALRELKIRGPQRPELDVILGLPEFAIYADDTDFISTCSTYLDLIQKAVGPIFAEFNLIVNVDKTERTTLGHTDIGVNQEEWKGTRKLGSLLGVE